MSGHPSASTIVQACQLTGFLPSVILEEIAYDNLDLATGEDYPVPPVEWSTRSLAEHPVLRVSPPGAFASGAPITASTSWGAMPIRSLWNRCSLYPAE